MPNILLIDSNAKTLSILRRLLEADGYDVEAVTEIHIAKERMQRSSVDMLICDVEKDPNDGMAFVTEQTEEKPTMGVIVLAPKGSVAADAKPLSPTFVQKNKPYRIDDLLISVERLFEVRDTLAGPAEPEPEPEPEVTQAFLEGTAEEVRYHSAAMHDVFEAVTRIGPTNIGVVLRGEVGTDKGIVAKTIHAKSRRRKKRFVEFDCMKCAADKTGHKLFGREKSAEDDKADKGLLVGANRGTIFLDNVERLPSDTQALLAEALKEKEIKRIGSDTTIPLDVRAISGTSADLRLLSQDGKFSDDLYSILKGVILDIPPLRERPEDILPMVENILSDHGKSGTAAARLENTVSKVFQEYPWPENVTELNSVVRAALEKCDGQAIKPNDLPDHISMWCMPE